MEIIDFLRQTQNDIRKEYQEQMAQPGVESPFQELIFTDIVMRHMADIGMTFDDAETCHFIAKVSGHNVRLSGYAFSEDSDQLDLFVSIYHGSDELCHVPDAETKAIAGHCIQFLQKCVDGKLSSTLDRSNDAWQLVTTIEQSYTELEQIRIYVLTDGQVKNRWYQSREVAGKTIKLEVMDIVRLFNHWQEGKPRDELQVNFDEVAGGALPCVWIPDEMGEYDYALTVVPGETLRFIYEKYGNRILEANVRSFLSQTGKVNKGIRDTLREQPERFMAYNNGIVIVVDQIRLGEAPGGGPGIAWMQGMQIVNGGQTTASMFFTKKKFPATNLRNVRVPAKVIVLKQTNNAQEEMLIADISRFSNSQNKVNISDLSANRPVHVQLEKMANTVYCPDGYSRWFYERANGSYKVMLEREGKTPAGIKRLKDAIPPSRRITKTDFAKYHCAWLQRPDLVSLGGQKNFAALMTMIDKDTERYGDELSIESFKNYIAQAIFYKKAYKLIHSLFPAFKANIAAYTVAAYSHLYGNQTNLVEIWNQQGIDENMGKCLVSLAHRVNSLLTESANGRMISEWAKKPECWDYVRNKIYFSTSGKTDGLSHD
ncbi:MULTISPECIES: MZA anti-phage system associated AIPR family protein MzaE [Serratia]|nr:MZA anti-phage system associated AIPR family protein MzaE [Serratia marcescens]AVE50218.1 abortive phage infection protein [Serratia marcescens]MBH2632101.1 AIPR family protein [Serratia marcescens]MBH2973482.1 AIPR family protein [Serratia marcescens]MBH2979877.1 AIPR family protein [Serratia marcescens]MBN3984803.1 AIPR family protein [Serratia marcescens]